MLSHLVPAKCGSLNSGSSKAPPLEVRFPVSAVKTSLPSLQHSSAQPLRDGNARRLSVRDGKTCLTGEWLQKRKSSKKERKFVRRGDAFSLMQRVWENPTHDTSWFLRLLLGCRGASTPPPCFRGNINAVDKNGRQLDKTGKTHRNPCGEKLPMSFSSPPKLNHFPYCRRSRQNTIIAIKRTTNDKSVISPFSCHRNLFFSDKVWSCQKRLAHSRCETTLQRRANVRWMIHESERRETTTNVWPAHLRFKVNGRHWVTGRRRLVGGAGSAAGQVRSTTRKQNLKTSK